MRRLWLILLLHLALAGSPRSARAQLPFYTDDTEVTGRGTLHLEFSNEYDALHSSVYPDLRQNTANFKVNYGLPHRLELDFDAPHLSIYRATPDPSASGIGDADLGIKWKLRAASPGSRAPALAASLYVEFPTGDMRQQLSSGRRDYWLNFIAQAPLSGKTRLSLNSGFLFAGNTSTGAVGIQTTRGHVFTGGLSLLHDFTERLTLGGELYGGIADNDALGRSQLQGMVGGEFSVGRGFSLTFAVLAGKYSASPRIGAQIGFTLDLPGLPRRRAQEGLTRRATSTPDPFP
jgi:Putative MetA-pathway of phenol degradation